jgi:hypothetical protein
MGKNQDKICQKRVIKLPLSSSVDDPSSILNFLLICFLYYLFIAYAYGY